MKEKEIIISLLDHPLKRIEIAKYISVITGSLSASLKKLHNLGLIGVNNENLYEIQEKLLARWLKKEYERYNSYHYIVI